MTLQLHDTFTDANGTLLPVHTPDFIRTGASWIEGNDPGVIQTNRYQWTFGAGGFSMTTIDIGTSEQFITSDLQIPTTAGGTPAAGIWFREVDSANNWLATANAGVSELQLFDRVASVFTKRAFVAHGYLRGDLVTLEVRAREGIVQTIDHTNSLQIQFSSTTHQNGTSVGMFLQAAGSTGWADDFKAYDMTPINTLTMDGQLPRMESFPTVPQTIKP